MNKEGQRWKHVGTIVTRSKSEVSTDYFHFPTDFFIQTLILIPSTITNIQHIPPIRVIPYSYKSILDSFKKWITNDKKERKIDENDKKTA